jgi:hypothetical protein
VWVVQITHPIPRQLARHCSRIHRFSTQSHSDNVTVAIDTSAAAAQHSPHDLHCKDCNNAHRCGGLHNVQRVMQTRIGHAQQVSDTCCVESVQTVCQCYKEHQLLWKFALWPPAHDWHAFRIHLLVMQTLQGNQQLCCIEPEQSRHDSMPTSYRPRLQLQQENAQRHVMALRPSFTLRAQLQEQLASLWCFGIKCLLCTARFAIQHAYPCMELLVKRAHA